MPTTTNITESLPPEYEDDVDLRRYQRFVTAHWLILVGGAAAGALVLAGIASYLPARYEASATLLIVQPAGSVPLVLTPATAKALIVSPALASQVVNEAGLNRDGITAQSLIDEALDIEPVSGTNVLKLNVTLSDPSAARRTATLLASKAVELMNHIERDAPSAERPALEQAFTEAGRRMKDTEDRLVDFQTRANLEALDAETNESDRERAGAQAVAISLAGERARLSALEHELAQQPEERQSPSGARAGDSIAGSIRSLLQFQIALSRATLSQLESEQRQRFATGTGHDAAAKKAEIYRRRLELDRLKAEYDERMRVYNDVRSQNERAQNQSAQLYLAAAPAQPDQPLPRRRPKFAALGALVGLLCGVVVAFVIDGRALMRSTRR